MKKKNFNVFSSNERNGLNVIFKNYENHIKSIPKILKVELIKPLKMYHV